MNKENVCVNRFQKLWGVLSHSWKFWLLISILIIVLIFEFVLQPMIEKRDYYLNYEINELYSHTTSQGYNIVIYEKGHPGLLLSNHHRIVIEVDGEEMMWATLLSVLTRNIMESTRETHSAIGNANHTSVRLPSFESNHAAGKSTTSCLQTDTIRL